MLPLSQRGLPRSTEHQTAQVLFQSFPALKETAVSHEEDAFAEIETLDQAILGREAADDAVQVLDLDGDGPLGAVDVGHLAQDGLVVPVFEAEPEAACGNVGVGGRGRRLGELLRRRGVRASAVDGGDEAGAVQGEGEA